MQTITKTIMLMLMLILSACVGQQVSNIYLIPGLSNLTIDHLATDMAELIVDSNPIKDTSFVLTQDRFCRALADQLSKAGYETAFNSQSTPTKNSVLIRYTIDRIDQDKLYIALTVNNSQRYIRSYTKNNGHFIPTKTTVKGQNNE